MNKIFLTGNLTRVPEVRYSGEGKNAKAVAYVDIAVNRKYKDEDGEYPTDFFRVVAFGGTAEFIEEYVEKGCKIAVDGELRNNNYEDEDGNMVYRDQLIVNQVEILKFPNQDKKVDKKKKKK